ncbi:MAG: hypothetical protein K9W44_08875 [Candidatus Lokiarchaeota archaeon]|nr:hypothetical protein [Candidatus Harpocratesius repetitus]
MKQRLISIDTAKGFGIFIMILVHLFTQAIARGDPAVFVPVVSQMSIFLWIILFPLIIMSVWGSIFTVMTCLIITIQMLNRLKTSKRRYGKFILNRVLSGALILLLYSQVRKLLGIRNAESRYRTIGSIELVFSSDTIDSIVFVGILIPIMLWVILLIPKLSRPIPFILLFTSLGVGGLVFSPYFIRWGHIQIELLNSKGWVIPEWILSKFIYGRFKIAQTFSFGCMGVIFGYMIYQRISAKQLLHSAALFFATMMIILGIAVLIDWHFLLHFADTDIPLPVQFFNLGGQALLLSVFITRLDYGSEYSRIRAVKRTVWLRRYGVVSFTIFTIGRLVGDGVY